MKWLLDTCALSDVARGDRGTLRRLRATPPDAIAISAVTVMEVEYGLARAASRAARLGDVMRSLMAAVAILPYGVQDAAASASLGAALEEKGRPIGAYDILIAGSALARGLVLVTSSVAEFERVSGLRIENWRSA